MLSLSRCVITTLETCLLKAYSIKPGHVFNTYNNPHLSFYSSLTNDASDINFNPPHTDSSFRFGLTRYEISSALSKTKLAEKISFDSSDLPEYVERFLRLENGNVSLSEKRKAEIKAAMIDPFVCKMEGDTGSSEVQIAALSVRIRHMTEHLTLHRKDRHSSRGLTGMLNKRKKLLKYIKSHDVDRYKDLCAHLNIRANI